MVLVLAIIIAIPNLARAVAVSALAVYAVWCIHCELTKEGLEPSDGGRAAVQKEPFNPPGALAPYAVFAERRVPEPPPSEYRGAIEVSEYDGEAEYGHRDRNRADAANAPEGNPYNTSRVAAPVAAGPCLDDEANDDTLDGDERMVYSSLSRNDATRVDAGIMNRRKDIDRYVREEVEEAEDREWWGRHEY